MTPFTATLCTVAAEPEGASTPMRRSGGSGVQARNRATRSGVGGTMGRPSLKRRFSNTAFTSSKPPSATMSPDFGCSPAAAAETGVVRCRTTVGERHATDPRGQFLIALAVDVTRDARNRQSADPEPAGRRSSPVR